MVQINADYYEDLAPDSFARVLNELAAGRKPKPGPQIDRQLSAPVGGATTLINVSVHTARGEPKPPLVDADAKKPGAAANAREAAVPKPPVADSSDPRR
jgi:NADH-quinone oxidoreductase subunit E